MEQSGRGGGAAGSSRGRRKRKPAGSNATAPNTASTPASPGDSVGRGRGKGRQRKKGRGGKGRGGAEAASHDAGSAISNEEAPAQTGDSSAVRGGQGKGGRGGAATGGGKKRKPRGKKNRENEAKQKELEEERKLKEEERKRKEAEEADARAIQAAKEAAEKRKRQEEEKRQEQARKRRKDIKEAAQQVRDARIQRRQKREAREKNLSAVEHRPTKEFLKSLDSGIKKNTSLIKKVKHSVTEENIASICKDIQRLNLSRYVSEVVSAIVELKMKGSDVDAVVQLCSLMHQRYSEFAEDLVQQLAKKISAITQDTAKTMKKMPDQEKKDLFLRRRAWLKLLVELFVSGVTEDSDLLLSVLSDIADSSAKRFSDSDSAYYDLWLLITFTRNAAEDILGLPPGLPPPLVELNELQQQLENKDKIPSPEDSGEEAGHGGESPASGDGGEEGAAADATTEVQEKKEGIDEDEGADDDAEDRVLVAEFCELLLEMEAVPEEKDIVTDATREQFWCVVRKYWERLSKVILKLHERLRDKEEDNHVTLQTKGVLPDGAADAYEQNLKIFEKLVSTASQLAEQLQVHMVELPKDDKRTRITSQVSLLNSNLERIEQESVFDDEDTRSFYEDLLDLRAMLPAVLFGEAPDTCQQEGGEEVPAEGDTAGGELEGADTEEISPPPNEEEGVEDAEEEEDKAPSSLMDDDDEDGQEGEEDTTAAAVAAGLARKNKLDDLLVTMQSSVNRDLIDAVAVDFCYVNSKNSRKKLVKALYAVGRHKLVLLPYYARLAATLNKCMPDIGPALVELLEGEFRFLKKKKDQQDLECKVKNIKFLSELVMFQVCPVSVIFKCLRVLCAEFVPHNIEVTCSLLETCGRYLYRSPETHVRTNNLLTTLFRLKSAKYLDSRLETMLENAYYHCKPPERAAIQRKVRPPMQEYIRHLLYSELSKASVKKVLLQLRKLPWDEQEDYVVRCLCKPWKVTYAAVPPLANVVASLSKFNSSLGVRVVDLVLEDIHCSLYGLVDASKNQRRVTTVRFLGELYYFCMVDANVIFDVLYTLIIDDPARRDDPRDCFPIRLICTLLSTCGQYFDRGASKKRLDRYLTYFQQYYFARPFIPIDIEYMVADAFELIRPKLKRFTVAAQADEAVEKLAAMPRPTKGGGQLHANPVRPGRFLVSSSSESFDDEEEEEEEEEEEAEEEEEPAVQSVVETQDYVRTTPGFHKQSEKVTEEDEEFDRMFKSMLQQSMDSRRLEPRGAGLTMVPTNLMARDPAEDVPPETHTAPARAPARGKGKGVMKFRLLVKKGNKPTAVGLEVPVESPLVIHTQAKMAEEKEAREDIKRYVLDYEKQEEQDTFNTLGVTHTGTGKERMSQKQRRAQQAGRIYSSTQRPYLKQQ